MNVARPLEHARPRLRGTIRTISELVRRIYSGREEILRLLEQPLISPELHGLFPAGAAENIPNYQASILFVIYIPYKPPTQSSDYILTPVPTPSPFSQVPKLLQPLWSNPDSMLSHALARYTQGHNILTLNMSHSHPSYELFNSKLRAPNPDYTSAPLYSFGIGIQHRGIPMLIIDCPVRSPLDHSEEDLESERVRSENRLAVAGTALLRSIDEHLFGGQAWSQDPGRLRHWYQHPIQYSYHPGPEASGYPDDIDEDEIRSKCLIILTVSIVNSHGRWGIIFVDGDERVVMHNAIQHEEHWNLETEIGLFNFFLWLGLVRVWLDREWIPAMCTALRSRSVPKP